MKITYIKKEYDDFILQVEELDLSNKITVVIGNIGAGKTTLLKTISRLNQGDMRPEKPYSVFYKQDSESLPNITLNEYLMLMESFVKEFDKEQAILDLKAFGFTLQDKLHHLSSGQKDIVTTLFSLCVQRDYIVLDEPFTRIDPFNRKRLTDRIIEGYEEKQFVIASHEIEHLERLLDYVVLLKDGYVVGHGKIDEIEEFGGIKNWYKTLYAK